MFIKFVGTFRSGLLGVNCSFSRYMASTDANVVLSTNSCIGTGGPLENIIRSKLEAGFSSHSYLHLNILNESYKHNVPKGSESHFNVLIVSDAFEGTYYQIDLDSQAHVDFSPASKCPCWANASNAPSIADTIAG